MAREQLERAIRLPDLGTDDSGCHILHVDMDAFFASVELIERPELAGRPVIIGREGGRGVVVSATYEARAFGVYSAMPMGQAMRACPQAIVIEPSRGKYLAASAAVMAILRDESPHVDVVSVDEAFIDVASAIRRSGSATEVARRIRQRVHDEQGLTCSIGVATVTMVAKIASTLAKPNGLLVVPRADTRTFLHALPVGRLWGVGAKTAASLNAIGIVTVADLAEVPSARLARYVGKQNAARLLALADGQETRPLGAVPADRTIGSERTFDVDEADRQRLEAALADESDTVCRRLRELELTAARVAIKVRFPDFRTIDRSHTLAAPTDSAAAVTGAAHQLLRQSVPSGTAIRLIGVRCGGLAPAAQTGHQLSLDAPMEAVSAAEVVMDQVAAKFGSSAMTRARNLRPPNETR